MVLSLRKYLSTALKWLIPFLFLEIFICILYFVGIAEEELFAVITMVNIVFLLPRGAYFLLMFFVYKRKYKSFTPTEGVIVNWEAGVYRYTGRVIVIVDGKEYSTPAYFSNEECKELVGKNVIYSIIDETLFLYEIKD